MDSSWIINKKRFLNKLDIMDAFSAQQIQDVLKFPKTETYLLYSQPSR